VGPPGGGPAKKILVPVSLPDGWQLEQEPAKEEKVAHNFAGRPQQAQPVPNRSYRSGNLPASPPPAVSKSTSSGGYAKGPVADDRKVLGFPSKKDRQEPLARRDSGMKMKESERSIAIADSPKSNNISLVEADRDLIVREGIQLEVARKQSVSGAWGDSSTSMAYSLRMTALTALAFISDGNSSRKGDYQPQVRRAIEFLVANIDSSGLLKDLYGQSIQTETQAIALLSLTENLSLSPGDAQRKAAQALLGGLLKLRSQSGLWLSQERGEENISSTIWAVLALRGCKNIGLAVDNRLIEDAAKAIASKKGESLERILAAILAEQKIDPQEAEKVKQELLARDWSSNSKTDLNSSLFALIFLRKIDETAFGKIEAQIKALEIDPSKPVASWSARYLALTFGRGSMAALK
jgi:hypothetical protein